jgi:hypothetical protein
MDKNSIKIIDDFLSLTYADAILNDCKEYLQYSYMEKTTRPDPYDAENGHIIWDENTYDVGQHVCLLFDNGHPKVNIPFEDYFMFIKPLIFKMVDDCKEYDIYAPVRIKVNLLLKQENFPDNHYNIIHVDSLKSDRWSAVYYLNDSDGETILFNEFKSEVQPEKFTIFKKIQPKKNRLVLFNSSRYHASTNPKNSNERFIINFVMLGKQG